MKTKNTLTLLLSFIFLNCFSQTQIPYPSNASVETTLKTSEELKTRLGKFNLKVTDFTFTFMGNESRYSTQCDYIKSYNVEDYYVVTFEGKSKKMASGETYTVQAEVHYRRSNVDNYCKLDSKWNYVSSEVWDPVSSDAVKLNPKTIDLLVNYFKTEKKDFLFSTLYGYDDVVCVKDFKLVERIDCGMLYYKTAMLSTTKKDNVATANVLQIKYSEDKNGTESLIWTPMLIVFTTDKVNGVDKVLDYMNIPLTRCSDVEDQEIFKSDGTTTYDTLFAGYKEVGFEKIYNQKSVKVETEFSQRNRTKAFNDLLLDILSNGTDLKDPERIKQFLNPSYSNESYERLISLFTRLKTKEFAWKNVKIIDAENISFDYYGIGKKNKKITGTSTVKFVKEFNETWSFTIYENNLMEY
jgi:hypothetical protein